MAAPAGLRRTRVSFAKRVEAPSSATDFGSPMGDWQTQFTVQAGVRPLVGSEPAIQSRLEGRQPVVVTVAAAAKVWTITEAWRAEIPHGCECRLYDIKAVTPHADRTAVDFLCVYGGAVG